MKINDIIAEAGVLGSIGRGLAGAATGAVRMLDKAGGGDGTNVGTAAQRVAYTNKMKQTQNAKARAKANLPAAAFAEFNKALKQNNINLQNPQSFDPASVTDYLKSFAENYFAVGDEYHNKNQQEAIEVLNQALDQGFKKGVYSLQDAAFVVQALAILFPPQSLPYLPTQGLLSAQTQFKARQTELFLRLIQQH